MAKGQTDQNKIFNCSSVNFIDYFLPFDHPLSFIIVHFLFQNLEQDQEKCYKIYPVF